MPLRLTSEQARKLGVPKSTLRAARSPEAAAKIARRVQRLKSDDTPQNQLWLAVSRRFEGATSEFKNAVPGRKYAIDIAFPIERICIEVDGWEYHGKFKKDFLRDREKRNALAMLGWVILAYPAGRIIKDREAVLAEIGLALASRRASLRSS